MYLHPHEFEHYIMQHIDPLSNTPDIEGLFTLQEVYVYDFIDMRNNTSHAHILQIPCAMLHGVHAIFSHPAVINHTGFNPLELSTLETEEGKW